MRMFIFLCLAVLLSCTEDKKTIEEVTADVERGAVLRTVEIRNGELDISDINSTFNILLEEQDIEDGDLLESVDIHLSFIDNSPENGDQSVSIFLFEELQVSDFGSSSTQLPRTELIYSFQELLNASSLLLADVRCKDQFRLDLTLNLIDGRIFSISNAAGTVVNNSGFFKSPFSYLVNLVELIDDTKFTGVYRMETIQDGGNGIPFGIETGFVEVRQGHSNNVRVFGHFNPDLPEVNIEFSVVCDIATVTRYQKSLLLRCGFQDPRNKVLIGPDAPPGVVDPLDDSVFELYILEGFEGYNGECDYEDIPSKYRFTKQ